MRKRIIRKIKMKRIAKVLATILIFLIGCLVYAYSKKWGEQEAITLCVFSWLYLFFGQFIILYSIWEA